MKSLNGHSNSQMSGTIRHFWNDFTSNEKFESAMARLKDTPVIQFVKIASAILSTMGIFMSIKWACTSSIVSPEVNVSTKESMPCSTSLSSVDDLCPWKLVFSDMANRLQLLEMAFKDQVVARLSIEKEVSNQSYVNLLLDKKLAGFLERLEHMKTNYHHLERKYVEMSSRLYSDESLGFLVIVVILIEILLRVRPHVEAFHNRCRRQEKNKHIEVKESTQSKNGVNYSPKHGVSLKNELCIIVFKRDNNNIISTFIDVTLKNLDDVKLTTPSHYVMEKHDMLRQIPRARLYLVVYEIEDKSTFGYWRHLDNDIQISTVRFIKSLGAGIILLVANDEASKKLTSHSLYNTSLRFIQSNDVLQELASNGKVFSMCRELSSHQMSHLRKNIKTVLCLKNPIR